MSVNVSAAGRRAYEMSEVRERGGYAPALLAYALALPLLLLVPPYFTGETGLVPGFTWQEAVDLFTPLVIISLAALAIVQGGVLDRRGFLAFAVIASVWVSGQGLHLAANAITDAVPKADYEAFLATNQGQVAHWLDEVLSHWVWHAGWVALVLLMAWSTWAFRSAGAVREGAQMPLLAGAIQGFTWFVVTVEGVTAALGVPAAVVFGGLGLLTLRTHGAARTTALFLLATGSLAILGYAAWAGINCGQLPEFTKWSGPLACGT